MTAWQGTRRRLRWRSPAVIAVAVVLTAVAGCGTGALTSTSTVAPTAAGPPVSGDASPIGALTTSSAPLTVASPAAPVAAVSASPGFGAAGMAPAQPVTVTVARGVIDTLTMTGPDGAPVAGTISLDRTTWTLGQNLAFGASYTVTGNATGTDGRQVPITGTFSTAGTDTAVRNTVYPGDDAEVGVAAPVIVYFGVEPADKAAVAKHVTLTSTPAVEGAWAWIK
ncbi:MAG TPA: Ig-like domain-containing protein, partial [Nakamurella sp.]